MNRFEEIIKSVAPSDAAIRERARARLGNLIMPYRALGDMLDIAEDVAAMTGSMTPQVSRRTIVVMAGDHGIARDGVSKYPVEVTLQMIGGFVAGVAGINIIAKRAGAKVVVVDMGVNGVLPFDETQVRRIHIADGTNNIANGPAMTCDEAVRSVEGGIAVALELAGETDVFGTGDMGIGNTTPSSAITAVMTGMDVADVTGRGTGIDDKQLQVKIAAIRRAIDVNNPDAGDVIDVLAKIGGFEIGGIAGLIIGAAYLKKPVVIDGFISTAGALIAQGLCPACTDYMIAAHKSVEIGHVKALEKLGKRALLDLSLRLGEGTGAALAMNIIDASIGILTEMATFDEAGVSQAG